MQNQDGEQAPALACQRAPDVLPAVSNCVDQSELSPEGKVRFRKVVFKFLTTWFGFLILITGVCLLANVEWARPKVEEEMSASFHRTVRLGQLSWTLGLNGLAIGTDRLSMREKDGKPFILSGRSEIGVAFIPLFSKRVIIKYVHFHRPEVFATQIAPSKWNFSDLMVEGPEIRYVEVDDGRLHLRNEITDAQLTGKTNNSIFANTKWRSYDFESVSVKLIFPKKNQQRQWPFYLAFKLPRKNAQGSYVSDFSLTLMANGTFDEWRNRKCTIDVRGERFNPEDWRPFFKIPDGVSGLVGFKFHGQGVVNDVVSGELKSDLHNVLLSSNGNTVFTAADGKFDAKLALSSDRLCWDQTTLRVGGLKIASNGEILDWTLPEPEYDVKLSADLNDLADLSHTSLWRFFPGFDRTANKPPDLKGAAIIELNLVGSGDEHQIYTSLKANNIPLSQLLSNGDRGGSPLLSLFEIEPNAPIKGLIEISPEHTVLLKDVELPAKGGVLKVHGFIDAAHNKHDVFVSADDLALNKFDTAQLESGKGESGNRRRPTVGTNDILISGKIDLAAHFKAGEGKESTDVNAKLQNASLNAGAQTLLATGLNGTIVFDGKQIKLSGIHGSLATSRQSENTATGGAFVLDGMLGLTPNDMSTIKFSGNHVDIGSLIAFTRSAHIPIPESTVGPMHGLARQIEISIVGRSKDPKLLLTVSPEDMYYSMQPTTAGTTLKPLKISSGSIVFADNTLDFKDLAISAQTGRVVLTASFQGQPDQLAPRTVRVKSIGVDVPELQQYLSSQTLAEQSRKAFEHVVAPLGLSSVQGKIYGDLKLDFARVSEKNPQPQVEGVIGLNNVSGKYGHNAQPVEHLSGLIAANADEIAFQDIHATLAASHIVLQGTIKKFQTPGQEWRVQLTGQVRPQDLEKYWPQLTAGGNNVRFSSGGSLGLKCTVSNDGPHATKMSLLAKAEPNDDLHMDAPFGSFVQPAGTAVTIDGDFVLSDATASQTLDVRNCNVIVGDSTYQTHGKYQWPVEKTGNVGNSARLDCSITTPNAVPLAQVMKMSNPQANLEGVEGTIKIAMAMAGPPEALLTRGDILLSGISVPTLLLKDLNGHIHTPRWSVIQTRAGDRGSDANKSEARVSLSNFRFGAVPVQDLEANIVLEDNDQESEVSINNGTGTVAGGKITLNLGYGIKSNKWHMDLGLKQLQVDEFVTNLMAHSGEITGLADGKIVLNSYGDDYNSSISHLSGNGEISIYKGSVPKVGQLQEKLTQANLLQQGVFGFNLNNVVQSVLPVKTGNFDEASISFDITRGNMDIDRMTFNGNDLRLRAAGSWNIPSNNLNVDVAGNIPRVASSILPGAVGEVSRNFTLQKAVRVMTFRKLESLPSLPILGDIGTDDPRAFTFKVAAALSSPDTISHSIQKSFKWLPNKPNASAHPIPGLNFEINLKPSAWLGDHHHHSHS